MDKYTGFLGDSKKAEACVQNQFYKKISIEIRINLVKMPSLR